MGYAAFAHNWHVCGQQPHVWSLVCHRPHARSAVPTIINKHTTQFITPSSLVDRFWQRVLAVAAGRPCTAPGARRASFELLHLEGELGVINNVHDDSDENFFRPCNSRFLCHVQTMLSSTGIYLAEEQRQQRSHQTFEPTRANTIDSVFHANAALIDDGDGPTAPPAVRSRHRHGSGSPRRR